MSAVFMDHLRIKKAGAGQSFKEKDIDGREGIISGAAPEDHYPNR
jgi:hypothetical protein